MKVRRLVTVICKGLCGPKFSDTTRMGCVKLPVVHHEYKKYENKRNMFYVSLFANVSVVQSLLMDEGMHFRFKSIDLLSNPEIQFLQNWECKIHMRRLQILGTTYD